MCILLHIVARSLLEGSEYLDIMSVVNNEIVENLSFVVALLINDFVAELWCHWAHLKGSPTPG